MLIAHIIRFTWVSSLILWIGSLLTSLLFYFDPPPAAWIYNKRYCTYYCETDGCRHVQHLAHYHTLMKWQVNALHQVGSNYELANILVYWVLIGGFWISSLLYLLNWNKATSLFAEIPLALLFGTLLGTLFVGNNFQTLFTACVFACLFISHRTGFSLYDVYMLLFGIGIPVLTTGLAILDLLKYVRKRYTNQRASLVT